MLEDLDIEEQKNLSFTLVFNKLFANPSRRERKMLKLKFSFFILFTLTIIVLGTLFFNESVEVDKIKNTVIEKLKINSVKTTHIVVPDTIALSDASFELLGNYSVEGYCYDCDLPKKAGINFKDVENITVLTNLEEINTGTKLYIDSVGIRVAQTHTQNIPKNTIRVYYKNHADIKSIEAAKIYIIN